jgi:hypothetical protein
MLEANSNHSIESEVSVTTKAIASSSALVGECCILESGFSNNNDKTSPGSKKNEWVTGRVSGGLGSWIQQHRDRRKREALEREVEQQRLRLYEAATTTITTQHPSHHGTGTFSSSSLAENATFQQLTLATSTTPHPHDIDISKASAIQASRSGSGMQVDVLGMMMMMGGGGGGGISDDHEDMEPHVPQVRWEEEESTAPNFILSLEQMNQLSELALPVSIAYSRWKRIYCLARDGDSFDQFLHKVEKQSHTLLVIRTTKGAVFGAYAESPWEPHGPAFYGSAQACLFSFPNNNHDEADNDDDANDDAICVFKWTGENRYIQVCDSTTGKIACGGGGEEGAFGLCLEHDFRIGSTGPCDTFHNEPLCPQGNFEVVDVEVYGFLLGQF